MAANDRPLAEHKAWIAQVDEEAIEPELPICDPHHHLWLDEGHTGWPYTLQDLHDDTESGHNVVQTVFLQCHAQYRTTGPEHLRAIGETEFVADLAEQSAAADGATIAGIVGDADLALGQAVEEVLVAHEAAGRGLFRGIRYITASDSHPPLAMGTSAAHDDPTFLAGLRTVGTMGYSFDAMVYHPQLPELVGVAQTCPETPIVIDHLGGFLGTGPYKDTRAENLVLWRAALSKLAKLPNVFLKTGGIGMPMMGFRWDKRQVPANSDELVDAWQDPIRFAIDTFGPERCMFESNFPVDKRGAGYVVLWNAFKRISAAYSPAEKRDLFHDTAARFYRLEELAD